MTELEKAIESLKAAEAYEARVTEFYDNGYCTVKDLQRAVEKTMDALACVAELEQ